ncbi:MAG: hypothetical protein K2X39_06210 [Silvanigrellaceae bacterium]|nr:hypothetical protein [Silvanigrellaceae bacterium]
MKRIIKVFVLLFSLSAFAEDTNNVPERISNVLRYQGLFKQAYGFKAVLENRTEKPVLNVVAMRSQTKNGGSSACFKGGSEFYYEIYKNNPTYLSLAPKSYMCLANFDSPSKNFGKF